MAWTADQVLALAPDPSSAKSGKDLGVARKWKTLGVTDACAWGTLQGSGKDPYQTCIDLAGPAMTESEWEYINKGGTGFGIAALTEFITRS